MNQQRAIELAKKWNEEHHYLDPIKWVAMDENLRWFGYPNEPTEGLSCWRGLNAIVLFSEEREIWRTTKVAVV